MLTEREHAKALNRQGWAILGKKFVPGLILSVGVFLIAKHTTIHEKRQMNMFYNRSKMYGGLKNPQY
jgi:hypothetical protein